MVSAFYISFYSDLITSTPAHQRQHRTRTHNSQQIAAAAVKLSISSSQCRVCVCALLWHAVRLSVYVGVRTQ